MPSQHDLVMPVDGQMFVVIDILKRSAMNKSKKRSGLIHIKNLDSFLFHSFEAIDSKIVVF